VVTQNTAKQKEIKLISILGTQLLGGRGVQQADATRVAREGRVDGLEIGDLSMSPLKASVNKFLGQIRLLDVGGDRADVEVGLANVALDLKILELDPVGKLGFHVLNNVFVLLL